MCGIAGFMVNEQRDDLIEIGLRMAERIKSRGPDSFGTWSDASKKVVFAHRRLAVLDLSPQGHQPMTSANGEYVISYNGEIYNFKQIADDLKKLGLSPKGNSDTEVLLLSLQAWGLDATLQRIRGMFAFALWNTKSQKLHLVRDRLGEKPLYFGKHKNAFLFSSEIKSFFAHPEWRPEINREALSLFLQYQFVPAPLSIFSGIQKLEPATYIEVDPRDQNIKRKVKYWDAEKNLGPSLTHLNRADENTCLKTLEDKLREVIRAEMISDVPLGAFLSGGVDSSLIVALMQSESKIPVKTFTIGFSDPRYNEASFAKAVSAHLKTDHTEFYLEPKDCLKIVPGLGEIYSEPFADSSQIPSILVSQLARKKVTVALSGDGGDELFCGYNRYRSHAYIQKLKNVPSPVRTAILLALKYCSSPRFSAKPVGSHSSRIEKLIRAVQSPHTLYKSLLTIWPEAKQVVLGAQNKTDYIPSVEGFLNEEKMMIQDLLFYLPNCVLTKVDRAAMSASLETRAPFLDHTLVELAWQIPFNLKMKAGNQKYILKKLLSKFLPPSMIDRPKMGFNTPLADWLRKDLHTWASDLLSPERLRKQGLFDEKIISDSWRRHNSGADRSEQLWSLLIFQNWYDTYLNKASHPKESVAKMSS